MTSVTRPDVAAIDLFAGAGGFGLAAEAAGADLRLSVELDPVACVTLKANQQNTCGLVVEADVTELSGGQLRELADLRSGQPLVVVGGPPCQPFSKAAYWTESGLDAAYRRARAGGSNDLRRPSAPTVPRPDRRRSLVEHFTRLVIEADANGFVFENVPSIAHPRNRPILDGLLSEMQSNGYKTTVLKANAASYGVAQSRERIFVMGSRESKPLPPPPTHQTTRGQSAGEGLGLLPVVTAGAACAPFADSRFAEPEEVVTGRWSEHLRSVPPGWNYKAHTAWGGHPAPTFITETRYWSFLLKLSPSTESWTIAATPGPWTGPFHWESRRLRIPELAALQGFPQGYEWAGTRRDRVRQIGNAVPPPMAARMIQAVVDSIKMSPSGLEQMVT